MLANDKITKYKSFVKSLKKDKAIIFHADNISGEKMGQIHALMLQLPGKGIIAFDIADLTKIGTTNLNDSHVTLFLPNAVNEDGTSFPTYTIDSWWEGLTWE